MATINPVPAPGAYSARTFATLTASDSIPLQGAAQYLLHFKNTTAGALTALIADPTSVAPAGLSFASASVSTGAIAATTGEGYLYIPSSDRYRDANGNMNISGAAGLQLTVLGPL